MKKLKLKKQTQGFTIIEVVLVLAIAGLIFLMVFIALPALQRNQRDTQRKNDLAAVQSAIKRYQANNKNKSPSSTAELNSMVENYIEQDGPFLDPNGNRYRVVYIPTLAGSDWSVGRIVYNQNAKCVQNGTEKGIGAKVGTNNVALIMPLETGRYYCLDA